MNKFITELLININRDLVIPKFIKKKKNTSLNMKRKRSSPVVQKSNNETLSKEDNIRLNQQETCPPCIDFAV